MMRSGDGSITPTGVRVGGIDHEVDAIVYATGFDAMTGSLLKIDARGPGTSLQDAWAAGPRTYLGLAVQEGWVEYVNAVASMTLFPTCNSWYLGANVPGKNRVFMPLPGFPPYAEQCAAVAANGYDGFALS